MPDVLTQIGSVTKEMGSFREQIEASHKDKEGVARCEALLEDILCVLYMEHYIRPRFDD